MGKQKDKYESEIEWNIQRTNRQKVTNNLQTIVRNGIHIK